MASARIICDAENGHRWIDGPRGPVCENCGVQQTQLASPLVSEFTDEGSTELPSEEIGPS